MNKFLLAAVSLTLVACASRPDGIAPTSVSALEFKGMSCLETKAMLDSRRKELSAYEKKQRQAATLDAVGTFLVLVPVSTVFGGDNEGQVAQAKGEVAALERAIPMNCADTIDS